MIIAANFKTNMTRLSTKEYVNELTKYLKESSDTNDIFIFPPATALDKFETPINIGAQNAYICNTGAFTGEIGLEQLNEFDIKTILIGHSERRHVLGESNEEIVKKFNFYKENNFKIIYCIGETLETREKGYDELIAYLDTQLEGIDLSYKNLIIAYEPVWAIGTGVVPKEEDILKTHSLLREKVKAPLLYGGSVKVNNSKEILALENVDGILVGGASLFVEHFSTMISHANK
ncbi:MAG: triose-phosphate isomerase [Helicobacteraceae bacterium]|nr:triose-phosphate isomerase [Helicobacteraceae bacterium]